MKPILMNPADTLSQMVSSQSNGIGRLNAISCIVTEERNGMYEAELSVFIDDEHFSLLSVGSVLKIMTNEGTQLFRVYQITKPMNGNCTVFAHHITYDLSKAPVLPFSATGASNSLNGLVSHLVATYPFTVFTDITNTTSKFTLQEPQYFRECLGGYEGSILDVFGGEYEWDNLTVRLLTHRGNDAGVQIRYGKNMIDVEQETNIENMYTAVLGFATVDDVTTTGTLQTIVPGSAPKTLIVDFSNQFDSGDTVTDVIIDNLAQAYISSHNLNQPRISIDVSFVALAETDQYKEIAPLEHVKLCDTVHVYFERLGIEASAKVVKTEYDSLNERLTSVEVGDAKSTMTDMIDSNISDAEEKQTKATNAVDSAVQNLTNMILNSLGLFVTKVQKTGGGYQYYMHNRPELSDSQYQWTINAGGFAVSQDYGATWSAGFDVDGNAVFNSLAANVINAMEINGGQVTAPKLVFNVDTAPSELSSGYYTMYDFVDAQTKQVYGAELKTAAGDYATGFIVNGGFALESKVYPSFIETENDHRLEMNFGSVKRKIDNRSSEQVGASQAGLYIANDTANSNYIVLRDNGNMSMYSAATVDINGGTVKVGGGIPVTGGNSKFTCSTGTADGHTVVNFFLNGSYVGHTVY